MQMAYDVFISYSRKDKIIAEKICASFDEVGVSYFIDRCGILSGQDFINIIIKAINESTIFLFLASNNSYLSQITIDEVYEALDGVAQGDHQIITYIIDRSELPQILKFRLRRYNWRRMEEDPIDSVLVPDICKLLNKEHAVVDNHPIALKNQSNEAKQKISSIIYSLQQHKQKKTNAYYRVDRYVDLGLSVRWATCNLGADKPEKSGGYFKWKEAVDLRLSYGWRLPTLADFKELIHNCSLEKKNVNGVDGYIMRSNVPGYTDRSVFFPSMGLQINNNLHFGGTSAFVWSSSLNSNFNKACSLHLCYSKTGIERTQIDFALPVRPVFIK